MTAPTHEQRLRSTLRGWLKARGAQAFTPASLADVLAVLADLPGVDREVIARVAVDQAGGTMGTSEVAIRLGISTSNLGQTRDVYGGPNKLGSASGRPVFLRCEVEEIHERRQRHEGLAGRDARRRRRDEIIATLREEGKTLAEIVDALDAEGLGVDQSTVSRRLRQVDRIASETAEMIRLRSLDPPWTQREIAEHFGINQATVSVRLAEAGFEDEPVSIGNRRSMRREEFLARSAEERAEQGLRSRKQRAQEAVAE